MPYVPRCARRPVNSRGLCGPARSVPGRTAFRTLCYKITARAAHNSSRPTPRSLSPAPLPAREVNHFSFRGSDTNPSPERALSVTRTHALSSRGRTALRLTKRRSDSLPYKFIIAPNVLIYGTKMNSHERVRDTCRPRGSGRELHPETPRRDTAKRISCVILVPATPTPSSRVGQFSPRLLLCAPIYGAAVVVSAAQRKALSRPSIPLSFVHQRPMYLRHGIPRAILGKATSMLIMQPHPRIIHGD